MTSLREGDICAALSFAKHHPTLFFTLMAIVPLLGLICLGPEVM